MTHIEYLTYLGACEDGIAWASTQPDMDAVWSNCQRADWMLWLVSRCKVDSKVLVTIACEIARDVLPIFEAKYPNDNSPRVAIETAERFARGEATLAECRAASYAASAAYDAYAAAYDAYAASAAYAAYAAAYDAYAASAAYAAASAAAYDAYAASYAASAASAASADYAARSKALARYADIVRRHIPTAPGGAA